LNDVEYGLRDGKKDGSKRGEFGAHKRTRFAAEMPHLSPQIYLDRITYSTTA